MSKIRVVVVTVLLLIAHLAILPAAAQDGALPAQDDLDILLSALRANRKAMVAVNMQLTEDEAAKFWPVYDRYQKEINGAGDRLAALIEEYAESFGSMSNEKAMKIVDDYLTIEADRLKIRRTYVEQFAKALPGTKVARFYQLENKMDAEIDAELAVFIPLMEAG